MFLSQHEPPLPEAAERIGLSCLILFYSCAAAASARPAITRLTRVSLTVLRLAIAEMLFGGENKPGVAINEAVELTKKYGADEDYQFVNGLLGAVARDHGLDADAAAEQAEQ